MTGRRLRSETMPDQRNISGLPLPPAEQTIEQFLAELERVATDWRYSTEFVGILVRSRWPANYEDGGKW